MSLERARRRRAPVLGLGIALGLALAATIAGPVAAANNVVVLGYFGDCQFAGSHAGASKTVKIEWRDSDGNLKSKHSVTSNGAGNFLSRCEAGELIEKGDVLKTTIGTAVRAFTVPKVTVAVDRFTDIVSGKVDPAADLFVDVLTYDGGFAEAFGSWHSSTPVPSAGSYETSSWDTSPQIASWDDVYVSWVNTRGDTFVRYVAATGVRVWVRQQFFEATGNPGAVATVGLLDFSLSLLADGSGRFDRNGQFVGDFLDADGDPVRIKAGNKIDFAGASFDIPIITATANKSTDRVTATCGLGSGHGVLVQIRTRDLSKSSRRTGFIDGGGTFVANFGGAPSYNIVSGDKIDIFCKVDSGNVVARTFTVP